MKTLAAVALLLATGTAGAADERIAARFNGVWQLDGAAIVQLHARDGKAPPLQPAALQVYLQRSAQLAAGDRSFDPGEQCRPLGNPRLLWENGWPFDLQITARRILFGYTWNRLHRLVDVQPGEPQIAGPTYLGTSTAQFDGDTLVVHSGGYNTTTLLDASGMPHSDEMTLVERYRITDGGRRMQLRLRITDPQTFTRPWEALLRFKRIRDGRIREDVCEVRQGLYKASP